MSVVGVSGVSLGGLDDVRDVHVRCLSLYQKLKMDEWLMVWENFTNHAQVSSL